MRQGTLRVLGAKLRRRYMPVDNVLLPILSLRHGLRSSRRKVSPGSISIESTQYFVAIHYGQGMVGYSDRARHVKKSFTCRSPVLARKINVWTKWVLIFPLYVKGKEKF